MPRASLCWPHDRPFEQWTSEERKAWRRSAESAGYDNPNKGILFANWDYRVNFMFRGESGFAKKS